MFASAQEGPGFEWTSQLGGVEVTCSLWLCGFCMGSLDSSHSRRRCECNSVNSCLSLCDGPAIDWRPSQGVPRLLSYHSWAPAPNPPPSNSCSTELKRVDWRDGSKYYFSEIKFWMRTLANKVQLLFVNHCAFSYLGTSGPAHHHFMSTSIFFSVFLVFVCLFFLNFFSYKIITHVRCMFATR